MWVEFLPRRISLSLYEKKMVREGKNEEERSGEREKRKEAEFFLTRCSFLSLSFSLSHPFFFSLFFFLLERDPRTRLYSGFTFSPGRKWEGEYLREKEWRRRHGGKEDIKNSKEEKREGKNVTVDVLTPLLERLSYFLSLFLSFSPFLSFRIFCWRGKEENQKKVGETTREEVLERKREGRGRNSREGKEESSMF